VSLAVVVGGQYGSEAKGKLVSYLACSSPIPTAVVRCGGSNAGHTASAPGGRSLTLRQLPSGVVDERAQLYLAAGMILDLPVLLSEIAQTHLTPARLHIDPAAAMLDEFDRQAESGSGLLDRVGSTLSGTGSATARKVLRAPGLRLAAHTPELFPYLSDVSAQLNVALDASTPVIVEGTQGFGLSLHHSHVYPFATSRDTSAAAFLSEVGLSPRLVTDIFLVLRTYPIRVAGNSGPLAHETDWPAVTRLSGYPTPLSEFTTVTHRLRRVGGFDLELARRAVQVNRPTGIALHGLDYLDYRDFGKTAFSALSSVSQAFVTNLEASLGVPVLFLFTGPAAEHIIDRR
jgi:adenylosuccinate synthase